MMKRAHLWIGVSLACAAVLATACAAEVPHLIRYQGQLADSQNAPLEGPYQLTFRLYGAATGGADLWEETHPGVPIAGGQFSVLLGSITSLAGESWSEPRWLSIQVNTEPELSPRQQITSVPLAVRAQVAEEARRLDGKISGDLLSRANHTGTQSPASISPQGSGSGLDADTLDGKHANELITPRGAQMYSCPNHGTRVDFQASTATLSHCIGQLSTTSTCIVRSCSMIRTAYACSDTIHTCPPTGYLMP